MPLAGSRLVIGIPTVPRRQDYVGQTVDSIVAGIAPRAWERVEVVVFDASEQPTRHAAVAQIETRHRERIQSGQLTILRNPDGHPRLLDAALKCRPDDESPTRVDWRRKMVLDFVHLTRFCADRGDYYLHVEDDTIATADFFAQLTTWFDGDFDGRDDWAFLTLFTSYRLRDREGIPLENFFSACALMFRCRDLGRVAHHCESNVAQQVLDFLLRDFAQQAGKSVFVRSPPLFQHIGLFSSCDDETRPIQAARFAEGRLPTVARALREAVDVLLRDPKALPDFIRWRLAVLVPSLVPLVSDIRRALGRRGQD